MMTLCLRVEVSVPRVVYEAWRSQYGAGAQSVETALRALALLPADAQDLRWRLDVVNGGYVVNFSVPVSLGGEDHPCP